MREEMTKEMPKMTKAQLYTSLSDKTGVSKREVADLFAAYTKLVLAELKKGGEVKLPDLGKFKVRKSAARIGRNPATGKEIKVPAKVKAKFLPAKILKETVK